MTIVDREKYVIIIGGEKVYSTDAEWDSINPVYLN